jgi:hypothetical protein
MALRVVQAHARVLAIKFLHGHQTPSRARVRRSGAQPSDALPFGRLWYDGPEAVANSVGYSKFCSRSHDAVIRVYDAAGNVIETHEHAGEFKEP